MSIVICHDEKLKNYLASKGLKHQASGITPNTKKTYWVYNETPVYLQFCEEYAKKGEK